MFRKFFILGLGLMALGCRNDLNMGMATQPFAVAVLSENADGCRSPDEPGCDKCRIIDGDKCYYQAASGPFESVDPWYSETGVDEGCTLDAPKCAKCSKRDEETLRALSEKPVCDCTEVAIETDACAEPNSCGCYCKQFTEVYARCSE